MDIKGGAILYIREGKSAINKYIFEEDDTNNLTIPIGE